VLPPLPRPLGTLAFLFAWLVPWRPAFGVRAGASNLIFYVHHRDTIGRHIAKYGSHEPLLTRWLADYLAAARPGLFVDVGANMGWHALHAATHQTVEAVIAFEPDPLNAWLLDRNLLANKIDKVIVCACAVGAKPGVARLFRYKSSNFGRHSAAVDHGFGSRSVPVSDLDSALAGLNFGGRTISVLKIDVEGYEPAVIEGARETLARTEVVITEYSPDLSRAGALSISDMLAQLQDAGFIPFVLRDNGGTVRIDAGELRGLEGSIDVIWAKPEVVKGVNEKARGAATLLEIAEQNKRVVKPL
jgi:FkbM family methyltransferase